MVEATGELEQVADQVVLADYLAEAIAVGKRVKRLEAALRSCPQTTANVELIRALQAFRGNRRFLSAVTIVAEAGDLRRFVA